MLSRAEFIQRIHACGHALVAEYGSAPPHKELCEKAKKGLDLPVEENSVECPIRTAIWNAINQHNRHRVKPGPGYISVTLADEFAWEHYQKMMQKMHSEREKAKKSGQKGLKPFPQGC